VVMQVPVEAQAAACYAVGIDPDHAGSGRYARALAAALPYVEREILRDLFAGTEGLNDIATASVVCKRAADRLEELE
jgi:hypothetical protein